MVIFGPWIELHLLTFQEISLLVKSKIQVAAIALGSCYFSVAMIRNLCKGLTRCSVRTRTVWGCLLLFAVLGPAERLYVCFLVALTQ